MEFCHTLVHHGIKIWFVDENLKIEDPDDYRLSILTIIAAEERRKKNTVWRRKRRELELTRQQIADRAGINLRQYQKFESGERDIKSTSFIIACKVLEALEINIVKFYCGEYSNS